MPPVAPVRSTLAPAICTAGNLCENDVRRPEAVRGDTGPMTVVGSDALASPAGARVIALFGPTGVGKTELAVALAARLRIGGEDPVAVSADALQVYRGLETLTGAAAAAQRRELEHRLLAFVPVTETFSVARYCAPGPRRDRRPARRGPHSAGGGRDRAVPACRARRPRPAARAAARGCASAGRPSWSARVCGPCTPSSRVARPRSAARIDPHDAAACVRALELADMGAAAEPRERSAAVDGPHAPSHPADRPGHGARGAVRAHRGAGGRHGRGRGAG